MGWVRPRHGPGPVRPPSRVTHPSSRTGDYDVHGSDVDVLESTLGSMFLVVSQGVLVGRGHSEFSPPPGRRRGCVTHPRCPGGPGRPVLEVTVSGD